MAGGVNVGTAYVSVVPRIDKAAFSGISRSFSGIDAVGAGKKVGSSFSSGMTSTISAGSSAIAGAIGGLAASALDMAVGAVASLGSEMASAADGAQKFASTLDFAGVDTSTIDALTASTQAYADATVYDLNDIRNVTAQLAANGVSDYAQLAEAAGNLNAVAGGNADTFKSVGMVMTQTAGSGKLMTENWNQLTDAIPGASGALQQAMRDAGAFEGNFREAMENGEISADEFFAAVQKLGMEDVAVRAATSTSTIEGAMGNLRASVVGVGSQVVTALTPFVTGTLVQLSNGISALPGLLAPVGAAFQPLIDAVTQASTPMDAFSGVLENLPSVITNLGTMLQTGIQTVIPQIMTGLTTAMNTITANLPAIMQAALPAILQSATTLVTSVLSGLPGLITANVGQIVTLVSTFASTLGQQIPVVLPQILQAAMTALQQLVQNICTNLPTYVQQVVEGAKQLFDGIVQAIPIVLPIVIDGIGNLVRTVIEHIPTFISSLLDAAFQLFTAIVDAIPKVVPAVLDGIGNLLEEVWNTITSFDLAGAGEALVQGLANGISGAAGAVLDAIGGVVSSAIDWGKSLLGISSPSKVFAEIGNWTMQGFAIGVDKGSKYARSAVTDAMDQAYGARKAYGRMGLESPSSYSNRPAQTAPTTVNNYSLNVDGMSAGGKGRIEQLIMEIFAVMLREGVM